MQGGAAAAMSAVSAGTPLEWTAFACKTPLPGGPPAAATPASAEQWGAFCRRTPAGGAAASPSSSASPAADVASALVPFRMAQLTPVREAMPSAEQESDAEETPLRAATPSPRTAQRALLLFTPAAPPAPSPAPQLTPLPFADLADASEADALSPAASLPSPSLAQHTPPLVPPTPRAVMTPLRVIVLPAAAAVAAAQEEQDWGFASATPDSVLQAGSLFSAHSMDAAPAPVAAVAEVLRAEAAAAAPARRRTHPLRRALRAAAALAAAAAATALLLRAQQAQRGPIVAVVMPAAVPELMPAACEVEEATAPVAESPAAASDRADCSDAVAATLAAD